MVHSMLSMVLMPRFDCSLELPKDKKSQNLFGLHCYNFNVPGAVGVGGDAHVGEFFHGTDCEFQIFPEAFSLAARAAAAAACCCSSSRSAFSRSICYVKRSLVTSFHVRKKHRNLSITFANCFCSSA